ncbi:surfactant protein A2 precursor [Gallus gallus]|uniref:Surfactant protein A n=2 Tax=Gallus gallus TaxID=9031 RepID=Q90XB2_CHICK|nr:surfactant protein A2 precursor [Gallus gallus]AAK97540.1 surfactant protein A precursor [Gallus gallus]|eukprot:NP_989937.1 surfactant protein A2 precursor [Gallus gallus]
MLSYSFCMIAAAVALLTPCHAQNCAGAPELPSIPGVSGLLGLGALKRYFGSLLWPYGEEKLPECQWLQRQQDLSTSSDDELGNVLLNLRQRILQLEGVLALDGKITKVGEKIFASNGKEVNFSSALESCEETGGTLATPMNEEENKAIMGIVKQYNRYAYLGIKESDTAGQFKYVNNQPLNYTSWQQYEPNGKGTEKCVEMYTDGNWKDRKCNLYRLTVCEY